MWASRKYGEVAKFAVEISSPSEDRRAARRGERRGSGRVETGMREGSEGDGVGEDGGELMMMQVEGEGIVGFSCGETLSCGVMVSC